MSEPHNHTTPVAKSSGTSKPAQRAAVADAARGGAFTGKCYGCGEVGHTRVQCPSSTAKMLAVVTGPSASDSSGVRARGPSIASHGVLRFGREGTVLETELTWDTGASLSCLSETNAHRLLRAGVAKRERHRRPLVIMTASGQRLKSYFKVTVDVNMRLFTKTGEPDITAGVKGIEFEAVAGMRDHEALIGTPFIENVLGLDVMDSIRRSVAGMATPSLCDWSVPVQHSYVGRDGHDRADDERVRRMIVEEELNEQPAVEIGVLDRVKVKKRSQSCRRCKSVWNMA